MASLSEIRVPDLGGFSDVSVIDVLVKEGEQVDVDTPLITLETEKATMDVPSPEAGRIASLKIQKGGRVSQGTLIALLEPAAGAAKPAAAATAEVNRTTPTGGVEETVRQPGLGARSAELQQEVPVVPHRRPCRRQPQAQRPSYCADFSTAYAGPSVRKFARELGVDLARVKGSGPKGRLTHEDVKAFVKQVLTREARRPAA